ncbi:MAG: DUF2461 domain-containing protein [Chloroflexota bacterium]
MATKQATSGGGGAAPGAGAAAGSPAFTGFTPEALQFLADLAANNDRAWFTPRKAEFERLLKTPMEALCAALAVTFPRHGVPLTADPRRSPFRIHRDVRFSKDKSPYKTHHAAGFGWAGAAPGAEGGRESGEGGGGGGYFSMSPGDIYIGGGMWHPDPARLAAWRRLVDTDPDRVTAVVGAPAFVKEFGEVGGDRLTRVPQGFAKDHPHAELLKLKDVTFGRRLADAEVFSPKLPETIAKSFAKAVPLFELLASLPG